MDDPGEDPGADDIGSPGDRVPCRALLEPAQDQRARRLARFGAGADQIGEPAETVPLGEPSRAGPRRKPHRRRVAHQFSGELDLAGEDGGAAFAVARPALAETQAQIRRRSGDQRVAIEPTGCQGAPSFAPQPGQHGRCFAAAGGDWRHLRAPDRRGSYRHGAATTTGAESPARRRFRTPCPEVLSIACRNKESPPPARQRGRRKIGGQAVPSLVSRAL